LLRDVPGGGLWTTTRHTPGSTLMVHTHLLALCDVTGQHAPALVLLFPDRIDAPGLDATAKAVALAAACSRRTTSGPTFDVAGLRDRSGARLHTPTVCFRAGSWMALPTSLWEGACDTSLVLHDGWVDGLPGGVRPSHADFFLPELVASHTAPRLERPELWADSAPAIVALGVLDALGTVPFEEVSFDARVNPSWLTGLMVSCAQTLAPWLGDRSIPLRGYSSRPFPMKGTVDATERALIDWFASPETDAPEVTTTFWNRGQGFVQHLVRAGLLVPNAVHTPTAWVLGAGWSAFVQRFPQDLLDAGRACASIVPAFGGWSAEEVLGEPSEDATAHQRAARLAPFMRLEHTLSQLPTHRLRPGFAKRAGAVQRLRERTT
jgi:hypothetical protein